MNYATEYNFSSPSSAPFIIRGNWTNEMRVSFNALQTLHTQTYRAIGGFGMNNAATNPTDGIYWQYDTNAATFVYMMANNGTYTTNAAATTPVASTWYKIRIIANFTASTTNVVFTINDADSVTFSIPTQAAAAFPTDRVVGLQNSIMNLNGANNKVYDIDYEYLGYSLETTR